MMPRWMGYLLLAAAALVAAAAVGWWLGQPKPVQETFAPAEHQADGSAVLERRPDASAKPAHQVPDGAKVERVGRVTVKPPTRSGNSRFDAGQPVSDPDKLDPCPPVTVDWSIVREPDGGRRFLASSPDGTIVGGVDVPVESAAPPETPRRWAAGVSWSPVAASGGIWIERDVPVFKWVARVGVDVNQDRIEQYAAGIDARIRVGFAF